MESSAFPDKIKMKLIKSKIYKLTFILTDFLFFAYTLMEVLYSRIDMISRKTLLLRLKKENTVN